MGKNEEEIVFQRKSEESKKRKVGKATAVIGAAVPVAAMLVSLTPGVANAAAAYGGECGGGYVVIDSREIYGAVVYLTWSETTGNNCVVTKANVTSYSRFMNAYVRQAGGDGTDPWRSDPGQWTTYAGPVYRYARNTCIDWGGAHLNESVTVRNVRCK
ncbi:spore-associated protein A [Streptomyces sp. enrichment culture]|uniref:spore-associated protein A n=1 Tax=Streptomyces sp. enrichment culture TaxID=1795815 RepID=UPI003F546E1F